MNATRVSETHSTGPWKVGANLEIWEDGYGRQHMQLGRRLAKTTEAIEWLLVDPTTRVIVCATAGQKEAFLKHLGFYLRDNPESTTFDWGKCVKCPEA